MLIKLLLDIFDHVITSYTTLEAHLDPHFNNNVYLSGFIGYATSLNSFLPILDGLLPIMALWAAWMLGMAAFNVVKFVISLF